MAGAAPRTRRSFAWLRVVLLNVTLVIAGVGGYFLYFKNDREASLTDSYMRSLDQVAERIELFGQNGKQIGSFLTCGASGADEERKGLAGACEHARMALTSSPGFERVTLVFSTIPEVAATPEPELMSAGQPEAGDQSGRAGEPEPADECEPEGEPEKALVTVGEHRCHVFDGLKDVVRPSVLENSRVLYMPTGSGKRAIDRHDVPEHLRKAILTGVAVPVEDALAVPVATFPFDSLYLVKSDGQVIAQRELPDGPPQAHPVELIVPATERRSFTRLADLAQVMASTERSLLSTERARAQPPEPGVVRLSASQVSQVSLGDRLFRVFIQPIDRLALLETGAGESVDGQPSSALAVVGIVDERRFQRTALSVGYTPLAVLLGISILLIASLPLLRLFLTDRHMTVSRGFAWTVIAGCVTTLLVAMFVVVLWGQQRWQSHVLKTEVHDATEDARMRVQEELERLRVLVEIYRDGLRGERLHYPGDDDQRRRRELKRCRAVNEQAKELTLAAPSLMAFALALSRDGKEMIEYRASCRDTDPAVLNVPDRAYFRYWRTPPPEPAEVYFQRLISYLDGSRSFIVSTAWQPDGSSDVGCRIDGSCPHVGLLVSDMQELAMASATRHEPVGMRFALVTQGGEVVYHSYDELSVVENLLRETDSPINLVGALQIRKPASFRAQYHGAPITGYVTPVRFQAHRTYAPEMWLVGYVPTADLDALRFYGAMMGLPVLLMVAAGWTVIFVVATALPGRRYDMVFPNSDRAPVYRRVLVAAVAGSVIWIIGAWTAAATSNLQFLEQSPDLLLLGLLVQLAWLCSRPNELFVPGEGHTRAVRVYVGGVVLVVLALGVALGVSVPGIEASIHILSIALQILTLGGGWIPLAVWISIRRTRAGTRWSPRWPKGIANAYLGMWLALLAALVLHTMGSYLVLTRHWQESTKTQYQSAFCALGGNLVHQNIDAQLSRLPEDERPHNPWGRHLRKRLADRADPPCVAPPTRPASATVSATGDEAPADPAEPARWFERLEASLPSINASVGAARTRAESAAPILVSAIGDTLAAVVVSFGMLLGLFVMLRAVARRLFGLNVVFATHLTEAPFSIRASEDSRAVLYVESLRDTRVVIGPAEESWRCQTFRSLAQLEKASLENETLVILEGFEADIVDAERRMRLIQHLQRMVETSQPMLVIAPVLPSYWLTRHEDLMRAGEPLSIEHSAQWYALLEHFTVVTGCASHPRAAVYVPYNLRAHQEHLKHLGAMGVHESVLDFIMKEIELCPRMRHFLAPLSHEILHRIRQRHIRASNIDRTLVVQVLARALEGEFQRFWSMSSPDEQAELISVARGGYPNFADIQTIQSLMQRGLLVKAAGRLCLPCETFRHFVLTRSPYRLKVLQARRSREGLWGAVLPSLMVVVGLILAFIVASSSRGADLVLAAMAGLVALVPALNALVSLTSRRSAGSGGAEEA